MSALGWDRPSGWSRRSMQGQDLRAAAPHDRSEPFLTDAAQRMNDRFCENFPTTTDALQG
tara:strand:- start:1252 stop:1431 length:180 start_codon:yes stop_codon:yes gene_type:complete